MRWILLTGLALAMGCGKQGGHGHVHGDWGTDLPAALAEAKKEGKLVLMDFTGSDWCPPCQALHNNVLSRQAFVDYAEKRLVLVELDFPQRRELPPDLKKKNVALQKKFNVVGFPTLIVLDNDGRELAREVGLAHNDPADIIAWLDKFQPSKVPAPAPPTGDKNATKPAANNASTAAPGK